MGDKPRAAHGTLAHVAILLLAVAVRVWGLHAQSYSSDEIIDAYNTRGSWTTVALTPDGFPPLSGVLVHAWSAVVPGDFPARWLSVIIGVLTVAAMWRLGTRVGGPAVGTWAAAALTLSPLHIWISQEARAYALYVLFGVLALWTFLRASDTNRRSDWLAYVLSCAGGLYSHYYFALLPLSTALLIVWEQRRRLADVATGLIANVAIALVVLSLLPFLRADLRYQADYPHDAPFTVVTFGYTYFSLLAGFSVGPSLRELHYLATSTAIRIVLPWALLVGVAAVTLASAAWFRLRAPGDSRRTAIRLAVLATVPVLVGGILAEVLGVGFRVRYMAWVVIPLLLIVATGVASTWRPRWRILGLMSLSVVWVTALVNRRLDPRHQNEDMRAVAAYLRSNAEPSTPVFVISHYMAVPATFYLGPRWDVCALPNVNAGPVETSAPVRVVHTRTGADPRFWLAYSRPFHSDPDGRLLDHFVRRGMIRPRAEFAGVTLYEGRALPPERSFTPLACETQR